jgi:hypothetical protein
MKPHGGKRALDDPPPNPRISSCRGHRITQRAAAAYSAASAETPTRKKECRMTKIQGELLIAVAEALCADIPLKGMRDIVQTSPHAARIGPILDAAKRERDIFQGKK